MPQYDPSYRIQTYAIHSSIKNKLSSSFASAPLYCTPIKHDLYASVLFEDWSKYKINLPSQIRNNIRILYVGEIKAVIDFCLKVVISIPNFRKLWVINNKRYIYPR